MEYGSTIAEARLITISTNPSNNIYRLGQTMVLKTLAIEILGFCLVSFFSMGTRQKFRGANKGIKGYWSRRMTERNIAGLKIYPESF
jgi:hypothetical protein